MKSRKSGSRRGRPTGAPNKPKDIAPTPETLAKLLPDTIRGLPQELQEAAVAIDRAYWRLCGDLMSRATSLEPRSPGKPAEFSGPILILILRYQAWMREALRRKYHTESLIDMIIEGYPPEECDRRYARRRGTSGVELRGALKLYTRTRVRNLGEKLAETGDQHALTGDAA